VNRHLHILIACVLLALAPARSALAKPPTEADLAQAKTVFGEGRKLFDAGNFAEAAEKFKESYKLSKKPLLLYNIALAFDKAGNNKQALFFYRTFLAEGDKADKNRKEAEGRVKILEKEQLQAELSGTSSSSGSSGSSGSSSGSSSSSSAATQPKPEVKAKPAGTYKASDFQHMLIDTAPPGKPLDVTASVPEDAGWTVTLYYRGSGDAKFIAKVMRWRYKELVGRIPGDKVAGSTIQYYIDAKDAAGNTVARSGKSTSANLITIEPGATPRFYPDFTEDGDTAATPTQQKATDTEEDPLAKGKGGDNDDEPGDNKVTAPIGGDPTAGPVDAPKNKYSRMKWITTGVAGGLLAAAIITWSLGNSQQSNLETDVTNRNGMGCTMAPCFAFDLYDIDVQNAGERYNTLHKISMVTGVLATGVAAFFWYKERKYLKARDRQASKPRGGSELVVAPAFGEGFAGAAAAARF
jgi:hypothetical protein